MRSTAGNAVADARYVLPGACGIAELDSFEQTVHRRELGQANVATTSIVSFARTRPGSSTRV